MALAQLAQTITAPWAVATLLTFELNEPVGRDWHNERVRFPVAPDAAAKLPHGVALIDLAGKEVPYEVVSAQGKTSIELLADLNADASRTFYFDPTHHPGFRNDLRVGETESEVLLSSSKAGVRLLKSCGAGDGPIAALKRSTDGWLNTRQSAGAGIVTGCKSEVLRRGPVLASAGSTWTFASGVSVRMTFELQADDPAVQVSEIWSSSVHPDYELTFELGGEAVNLYYRKGQGKNEGRVALDRITDTDQAFDLEPWVRWWIAERRGTWVAAFGDEHARASDALIICTLRADEWVSDAEAEAKRYIEPVRLSFKAGQLSAHFPGRGTRRAWLAAELPRAEAVDESLVGELRVPPPQRLRIKHSDFPLDRLKDWIVGWPPSAVHARLMLTDDDLVRFWRAGPVDNNAAISNLPVNEVNLGRLFRHYYGSNDPVTRRRLSEAAVPAMREVLDGFLDQNEMFSLGFAPNHQRNIAYAVHLADFALADPEFAQADKVRLRTLAAAISYTLQREDYWSQKKGFAANPNMSSMVASYQGLLACLLSDHPEAERWLDAAIAELFDNELLGWSDANGGWLEAPHYAMVSQDAILGVVLCARNAGRPGLLLRPRLRRVIEWLAKTSTPPDIRAGNARMLAPIGNTYMLEPTGQYGAMAYLFRDIDPVFSARMQWMHRASGSPTLPIVGGFAPTIAPYQVMFKDPTLPAVNPNYGSELFPKTGAILRAHFGTDRETQVHIIAGPNHAHYDRDSGSITFWGKGRVLANDWGYTGYGSPSEHSMVDSESIAGWMSIDAFATGEILDHFSGTSGAWHRDITLVKDDDPLGNNFVLLTDVLGGKVDGTWRLWLTCQRLERRDWGIELIGRDDVDMAILFPDGVPPGLALENKTLRSSSSLKGSLETTQTGVVLPIAGGSSVRVLLLPHLKSEPSPRVSIVDGGKVIDLTSARGRDRLFAGPSTFEYRSNDVAFQGKIGIARHRGEKLTLSLGEGGRLEAEGHVLQSTRDETTSWRLGKHPN